MGPDELEQWNCRCPQCGANSVVLARRMATQNAWKHWTCERCVEDIYAIALENKREAKKNDKTQQQEEF